MKKSTLFSLKNTSTDYHLNKKIYLLFIIPLILLISLPIEAQNHNAHKVQWKSAGGEMLLSGKQEFTESWTSSRDSRDKGLWWQGGFYDREEDRNYRPWENTVKNSVSPLVGNITVTGPCNICVKQSGKGARITMLDKETQNVFTYCNLNNTTTFNGDFWGFIGENDEITLDVFAVMSSYNNMVNTGEYAYRAPQDVEYEVWYFPKGEGSKIISTSSGGNSLEKPQPGILYFTDKKCN